MESSEIERDHERGFIDSVFYKKCARGPIDPVWFTTALFTWPSGNFMSACLSNPAEGKYLTSLTMLFPILRSDGTEAPYPPVDVMAVRAILASGSAEHRHRA